MSRFTTNRILEFITTTCIESVALKCNVYLKIRIPLYIRLSLSKTKLFQNTIYCKFSKCRNLFFHFLLKPNFQNVYIQPLLTIPVLKLIEFEWKGTLWKEKQKKNAERNISPNTLLYSSILKIDCTNELLVVHLMRKHEQKKI